MRKHLVFEELRMREGYMAREVAERESQRPRTAMCTGRR